MKGVNLAASKQTSIMTSDTQDNQTKRNAVAQRWRRARLFAGKVGKGLSAADGKAKILQEKHWLEAIDPLHRYGRNLGFYFEVWLQNSNSSEPFFDWLDKGEGKLVDLNRCPRNELQRERVRYLTPEEREEYEVIAENGKLVYGKGGKFVDTEAMNWIYVLSTSRHLFVGKKERGCFHHSSFLAGEAVFAAGGLQVSDGKVQALTRNSGHYHTTKANFAQLIRFLEKKQVDLGNVIKDGMQSESCFLQITNYRRL